MSSKLKATPERCLWLDESGIYVWREQIRGRRYWKSTSERTLGSARTKMKIFRTQAGGEAPKEKLRRTFDDAWDLTIEIQDSKAKKTGVMARTQINGHLRPWFQAKCPFLGDFETAVPETWAAYRIDAEVRTPGRKLEHDRRHLLMAWRLALGKGWVTRPLAKRDLQLLEATEPVGRLIEDDELAYLLPEVKRNESLYLQVLIALFMGMRLREVLHLQWEEVDLKGGWVHLGGKRVKTRVSRQVPIHARVLPLLQARKLESKGPFVFPARHSNVEGAPVDWQKPQDDNSKPWERAKAGAARARAKAESPALSDEALAQVAPLDCRFHDLRHTAITHMLEEGLPEMTVSLITGASIAVIRRIYAHLHPNAVQKAKAWGGGKMVGWGKNDETT